VGGYVVPRITCATTVANRAHCQGIQEGKNERGSRGGNHLKGWMLVVPNVRGVLVPNVSGSMGCDRGPLRRCPQRGKGRAVPGCCLSICSTCCQSMVEIPEAVVHERDLSIKCVQSAVSESKTTRAARSRECTAPRQGGGAHARDSSIARCTRPSAVRHSTQ
jgi:hypothetical protein